MKNNYIIGILIITLVLSSFTIADEIQFIKDLEKNLKEDLPDLDLFLEGENYCDSKFFICNDEKKITDIELEDINAYITLPSSISTLTGLRTLRINDALVVIYWDDIVNSHNLRNTLKTIEIISNNFNTFLRLDGLNLTYLHLSYNGIKQNLSSISFSKTIKYINLSHNGFYGDINIFNNIADLEVLDLSYNMLAIDMPKLYLSPKLSVLDLSSNNLTGNIPRFNGNAVLKILNLSDNRLSGSIPGFSSNYRLTELDLSSNNLTGNIPSFSNKNDLTSLNISKNNLSGIIPSFSKNYDLTTLDVSYNRLSGNLSSFINNKKLRFLYLHNNIGFTYNCLNDKYLVNSGNDTELVFCKLGEVTFSKECVLDRILHMCQGTLISNAKSIYYINIAQVSVLLLLLLFT